MTPAELRHRCHDIMLTLDVPVDATAALNAGDKLAALLAELVPTDPATGTPPLPGETVEKIREARP
jgi:hypothetical protein